MRTPTEEDKRRVAALIPAAGSGQRMGGRISKPFLCFGGREILAHTVEVFENCVDIDDIWIIVAPAYRQWCQQAIVEHYGFQKVRGVVSGGATRQESVWQGLLQVVPAIEIVVVHDGVRPFVTPRLVQETITCAVQYGAAIAAVPLKDTLKRVADSGEVIDTIPREQLWRVQTPQAFRRSVLQEAFEHAWTRRVWATDEAGLVEALGTPIKVVPGIESNVKITTPDDLVFCEYLVHKRV